jgi:phage repressor protein C with HTH and peptisase S24 domain
MQYARKSGLWQRLKEARNRAGKTQQDVADWFGITRNAVALWESAREDKRTAPSVEQLRRFAAETGAPLEDYLVNDAAEVNAVWLPHSADQIRERTPGEPSGDEDIAIPEYRVHFSGGHGAITYEAEPDSQPATFRASYFQRERLNPARCKRFRVVGRSMEPLLFPGDAILVNLEETQVREGLVYVFRHGDELKVKRLMPRSDGSLVLRSVNREEFPDDLVPAQQVAEQITIIGRVRDRSGRGGL